MPEREEGKIAKVIETECGHSLEIDGHGYFCSGHWKSAQEAQAVADLINAALAEERRDALEEGRAQMKEEICKKIDNAAAHEKEWKHDHAHRLLVQLSAALRSLSPALPPKKGDVK
jgi:hypothetical protein